MAERILVIEDDEPLASLMRIQLERAGYEVSVCEDGPSGVQAAHNMEPDLVLLDILLPKMSGWTVYERLREFTRVPIIFTTALGAERDITRGLELGADDYIAKPFTYKELTGRVRAALHRAQRATSRRTTYENERLFVDLENRVVKVNEERISFTPLEYKLLAVLVQEAGSVVPHATLLRRVWGPQYEGRRDYLKLYILYLRQKIEADVAHPRLILTERGVGYRLVAPE